MRRIIRITADSFLWASGLRAPGVTNFPGLKRSGGHEERGCAAFEQHSAGFARIDPQHPPDPAYPVSPSFWVPDGGAPSDFGL